MNEELEIRNYQDRIADLEARINELEKECFTLAANQCHAGYGDEWGNHRCRRIEELEAALRETERVRDEWCAEYVRLRDCAKAVCWFDRDYNDTDAVMAIDKLRRVLNDCRKAQN